MRGYKLMQRYGRSYKSLHACEASETEQGYLQVNVVNSENNFPIQGADVLIRYQQGRSSGKLENSWRREPYRCSGNRRTSGCS